MPRVRIADVRPGTHIHTVAGWVETDENGHARVSEAQHAALIASGYDLGGSAITTETSAPPPSGSALNTTTDDVAALAATAAASAKVPSPASLAPSPRRRRNR